MMQPRPSWLEIILLWWTGLSYNNQKIPPQTYPQAMWWSQSFSYGTSSQMCQADNKTNQHRHPALNGPMEMSSKLRAEHDEDLILFSLVIVSFFFFQIDYQNGLTCSIVYLHTQFICSSGCWQAQRGGSQLLLDQRHQGKYTIGTFLSTSSGTWIMCVYSFVQVFN